MKYAAAVLIAALISTPTLAKDYYISPDGRDTDAGTRDKPIASPARAAGLLKPGDTLWVMKGTYPCPQTIHLRGKGKKDSPIRIFAAEGARPVFDFGEASGAGIVISGAWWHIKGLSVTGAEHNGIRIAGIGAFQNTLENVTTWANENTGIHLTGGASDNTILNCDSYENYDTRGNGEDADGFGAKFDIGTGNRFIGCRAWHNSDDGYDCWYAGSAVRFENCYAWANGVNIWKNPDFQGNGNGFKLGQLEGAHVLVRCAAWDQPQRGFDLNGNSSGVTVTNCTAFRCRFNFDFTRGRGNIDKNVLRDNLSFEGLVRIDPQVDDKHNGWNIPDMELAATDFQSLDPNCLQGPRNPDGTLPECKFLRLAPTGKAKGLGAFAEK